METKKGKRDCTISPKLLEAWKLLARKNDSQIIAKTYGWSRPTIDNALLYGYVSNPQVTDHINDYFFDRMKAENKTAEELLSKMSILDITNQNQHVIKKNEELIKAIREYNELTQKSSETTV